MTLDFKALDFKCGIEIHQQLDGKKLFCDCPCEIRKDQADFEVKRWLRASAGETGEVDKAAAFEISKSHYYLYNCYKDSTCLVELDEEPPHSLNPDALKSCLQVAKLLNMQVEDKIQFMRKVVVDGSNVSGFQRTALVGRDGFLSLESGNKIRIAGIFLEEEACQPLEKKKEYASYNLSRQGIPLIEIATEPDISSAEEAKETAARIGMILRSVPGMKRGIGTIRQDVNVSIKGGTRVEIKGFQEIKSIPKVIEYEVKRHLKIYEQGKWPDAEVRRGTPDMKTEFMRPMPGAARMYPETDIPIITINYDVEIPRTIEEQQEELVSKFSIRDDLAKEIIKSGIPIKTYLSKYVNLDANLIADTLINVPKEIKKKFKKDLKVEEHADEIFERLSKGQIPKSAIFEIFSDICQGKKVDYGKYQGASDEDVKKAVLSAIKENPGAPKGALMGIIMNRMRGKAEGKTVMALLNKHSK